MIPFYYDQIEQHSPNKKTLKRIYHKNFILYNAFGQIIYVLMAFFTELNPTDLIAYNICFIGLTWVLTRDLTHPNLRILSVSLVFGLLGLRKFQATVISFNFFPFKFSLDLLVKCRHVLLKTRNLSITIIFMFCFFVYLTAFMYKDQNNVAKYFKNFGWSGLSMLQVMTLDSWGQVGRDLYSGSQSISGQFILVIYIFWLTYFYFNILVGLVIEILQEMKNGEETGDEDESFNNSIQMIKPLNLNKLDNILLGRYYQFVVFMISTTTILTASYNSFQPFQIDYEIGISYLDDVLYTIHLFCILILNGRIYQFERESYIMMLIHFCSGPLALFFSLNNELILASLLNLLKLFTCPTIKGVFKGTFRLGPILWGPFITLITLTLFFSSLTHYQYPYVKGPHGEEFFSTPWNAFYTYIQVLTLDDWGATILRTFDGQVLLPYFYFIFYIFFSNFVLLNSMIALCCKYFTEIHMEMVDKQPIIQSKPKIKDITSILNKIKIKRIYLNLDKSNLTKSEEKLFLYLSTHLLGIASIKSPDSNKIFEIPIHFLNEQWSDESKNY